MEKILLSDREQVKATSEEVCMYVGGGVSSVGTCVDGKVLLFKLP